tara:strand:+ start:546 stop:719 length:174 start_codon:yes stop_codon:yes gene_type:complete
MEDIYNKKDKACSKQQIHTRLTLLGDRLRSLEKEKIDILADVVILKHQLRVNSEKTK